MLKKPKTVTLCKDVGMRLNGKNTIFRASETTFLGHRVVVLGGSDL